jgi:tape measure domain-containing protein
MGQEIHELRAIVTANITAFERMMKAAIVATEDFRSNFVKAAGEVTSVAARIATGVSVAAAGISAAVAKTGISFNELKENATIAFTTILKDGNKAQSFLAELQKFAAETPFTFKGLIQQSQFLLATGFQVGELIPTLRVLGDTMSGLGKGEDSLRLVALALSQMRNSARLMSQDVMQLTNAGIPAWQILAEQIGVTVGEVRAMSERGEITGQAAFDAIMRGLSGRFGGGMERAQGSFSQLLSNLKDVFDVKAGEVTQPLFESLKGAFSSTLDYLNSPRFSSVISDLARKMGQLGAALDTFIGANKERAIGALTDALSGFTLGLQNALVWLQESGPAIAQVAATTREWIQALGAFVARHPEVLAALAVFKGAEMLGVVSALRALISLLMSTGPLLVRVADGFARFGGAIIGVLPSVSQLAAALTRFGTYLVTTLIPGIMGWTSYMGSQAINAIRNFVSSLKTAEGAANGLKLALSAGAAAAIVAGFFIILQNETAKLNAALDKTLNLMRSMNSKEVNDLRGASADTLAKAKAKALNELMNREKEINDARKSTTWLDLAGAAISGTETPEETTTKARDEAKRKFDELDRMEREAREREKSKSAAETPAEFAGAGPGGAGPGSVEFTAGTGPIADAVAQRRAEAMQAARDKATRREDMKGLGSQEGRDIRKFIDLGPSVEELREFTQATGEFSAELVSAFTEVFQQLQAGGQDSTENLDQLVKGLIDMDREADETAKRLEDIDGRMGDWVANLTDMAETMNPEQIGLLTQTMDDLTQAFSAGQISAQEFHREFGKINQVAGQAADFQRKIDDASKWASGAQLEGFNDRMTALLEGFQEGRLTAEGFRRGLAALSGSMEESRRQAEAQAQAEERKRHAAGIFTESEVGKAIQDRMIGFQQKGLSEYAEIMALRMLAMNGNMQASVELFQRLNKGMGALASGAEDASRHLEKIANPEQAAQASAMIGQFLRTPGGQSANIQNQISMLMQILSLPNVDASRKQQVLAQIADLQAQLQYVSAPPPPMFSGISGAGMVNDPGLQTHAAPAAARGASQSIHVNLPNINKLSNADVRQITDAIANELDRRGRRG